MKQFLPISRADMQAQGIEQLDFVYVIGDAYVDHPSFGHAIISRILQANGFSVGIMWPGTFSIASASIRGGGTAMFALLALAGDLGCSGGPTLAGFVSSSVGNNLKMGILAAIVFPVLLLMGIQICKKSQEN